MIWAPISGVIARAANKCSAPRISVVSPNTEADPSSTKRSLATPSAGFAVIPESASEPPHSWPSESALQGALTRSRDFASFNNEFAIFKPASAILPIEPSSATFKTSALFIPNFFAKSIINNSPGVPIVMKRVA